MIIALFAGVGLSMEEWNSENGETFITIAFHYHHYHQQTAEPVLESKVLSTIHCSSEMDVSKWNIMLDNLFKEWEIKVENTTAVVVATNRYEVLKALSDKGLILVPCLLHSLQVSMNCKIILKRDFNAVNVGFVNDLKAAFTLVD